MQMMKLIVQSYQKPTPTAIKWGSPSWEGWRFAFATYAFLAKVPCAGAHRGCSPHEILSWCYCCLPLNIKKDPECIAMTIASRLISWTIAHLPLLWLFWVGTLWYMKWDTPLLMSSLSWCFTSLGLLACLVEYIWPHTHPFHPQLHPAFLCTHFS